MKKTIKIFNIILVLLLTVILVGCETKKNNFIPSTIPTVTDITPSSTEDVDGVYKINYRTYENQLYHEFWDVNSHIEFKIDIPESELALIQTDYDYYSSIGSKSPIYRKADVTIILNGKEYFYEEVGIRMKGNTSRRDFYDPIDGVYAMIHYKLAFNQTFDDESEYDSPKVWNDPNLRKQRKDRMFAGMDKLNLKWNKNFDETFSKESWAFNMFEEFGVLAPKVTPSRVQLQYRGQYENMGIFFVNENVDKYFLEKRLDEKHLDGDLYKVGWSHYGGELTMRTLDSIGVKDPNESYSPIYDLKTNKKSSDHSLLKNLITQLNKNDVDVSELVHLDNYLRFEAVSYLVGNPDDFRNNYNNYYIYFLADSNLAIIIPYDYDRVFGITKDWDPTGNAMTAYSPYTKRNTANTNGENQVSPLILKTVAKGAKLEYLELYREYILQGINSKYFNLDSFYKTYYINEGLYKNQVFISITRLKNYESYFKKEEKINWTFTKYITLKKETVNNLIDVYLNN